MSLQDMSSLRRATLVNSLKTWTLTTSPCASSSSARSAFAPSCDSKYRTTLVSTKRSALIGLAAIEREFGRQSATELAQCRQYLRLCGLLAQQQLARASHTELHVVAIGQI